MILDGVEHRYDCNPKLELTTQNIQENILKDTPIEFACYTDIYINAIEIRGGKSPNPNNLVAVREVQVPASTCPNLRDFLSVNNYEYHHRTWTFKDKESVTCRNKEERDLNELSYLRFACDLTCPVEYYLCNTAVGFEARYTRTNNDLFQCVAESARLRWVQRYQCCLETLTSAILNQRETLAIETLLAQGTNLKESNYLNMMYYNVSNIDLKYSYIEVLLNFGIIDEEFLNTQFQPLLEETKNARLADTYLDVYAVKRIEVTGHNVGSTWEDFYNKADNFLSVDKSALLSHKYGSGRYYVNKQAEHEFPLYNAVKRSKVGLTKL